MTSGAEPHHLQLQPAKQQLGHEVQIPLETSVLCCRLTSARRLISAR